jgi:hypothetical protein
MPIVDVDNRKLLVTQIGAEHAGPNIAVTGRKNIVGVVDIMTNNLPELNDGPESHREFHLAIFTTTNFTTAGTAEYNTLSIGSEIKEYRVAAGAVTTCAKWLKTGAATWAAI